MIFDGENRLIILQEQAITATSIWLSWVSWLAADHEHLKWLPALRQVGGDDLGAGLKIPLYIFLLNGWRVRPMEASHLLTIDGNLFVEGSGRPVVNTLGAFNVSVQYTVPVQAQAFVSGGSSGLTLEEHNKLMTCASKNDVIALLS